MPVEFDARYLPGGFSALLVGGHLLAVLVVTVALVRRARRHTRERARWRAAEQGISTGIDRSGPVVLTGHARWIEREGPTPVRVAVKQLGHMRAGREHSTVVWREQSRRVEARPFEVVLESGRRVLVEADASSLVFQGPFASIRVEGVVTRERSAELEDGAQVWVSGVLDAGSAGAVHRVPAGTDGEGARAVLRPGPDGTLLVSTEQPSSWHQRQLSFGRLQGALVLAIFAVVHGLALASAHRALFTGRAVHTTLRSATQRPAPELGFDERGRRGGVPQLCAGLFVDPALTAGNEAAGDETQVLLPLEWRACQPGANVAGGDYVVRVSQGAVARPGRFGALRRGEFFLLFASVFPSVWALVELERRRRVATGERLDESDPMLAG